MTVLFAAAILLWETTSCSKSSPWDGLQGELNTYIKDLDANIGIAVIVNRADTIGINGNSPFPMLSVYKFPIAVALGDYLRVRGEALPDTVTVTSTDLMPDTYSPLRDKYEGQEVVALPFYEIMAYALQQSDNNASDIILKTMGGADYAMSALKRLGLKDINIVSTEAEMHDDVQLSYANTATPLAMAKMIDAFDYGFDDTYSSTVKQLMETCATGQNRLVKPLTTANATVGHKTGTGFTLPDGRLMAINDVGYVHLPGGPNYSIAVFIENSGYDMPQTEDIIANISEIVYRHINNCCK